MQAKEKLTPADLPQDEMAYRLVRLTVLGALVWDYTNTTLELAAQMKLSHTKKFSRKIHELRRRYDCSRSPYFDDFLNERVMELSLDFETTCEHILKELNVKLRTQLRQTSGDEGLSYLAHAAYLALTTLDALLGYGEDCDQWMEANGAVGYTMIPSEFPPLGLLLPKYCIGVEYDKTLCADAAAQLLSELKQTEVCDSQPR